MKIAIRADASLRIGSGHVMRSLSLADALSARGADIRFVTRDLPSHLFDLLISHDHQVTNLPAAPDARPAVEAAWPAPLQREDARQTAEALRDWAPCDWLVVDHYGADESWERQALDIADRVMVIDDLGRRHACEMLLDANLYAQGEQRYAGQVPPGCVCLVGPRFALLRREFAAARTEPRLRDGPVRHMLVFMGGMDAVNATGLVLEAIGLLPPAQRPGQLDVVIGPLHPQRQAVETACAALGGRCHVSVAEMATLCHAADLAVGAGGTATWERCAVGLPTLALCVAGNQREILHHASRAGLLYTPDEQPLDALSLSCHLQALIASSGLRHHLCRMGLAAVDGLGANRAAAMLLQP